MQLSQALTRTDSAVVRRSCAALLQNPDPSRHAVTDIAEVGAFEMPPTECLNSVGVCLDCGRVGLNARLTAHDCPASGWQRTDATDEPDRP